jgi:hypothetical protein
LPLPLPSVGMVAIRRYKSTPAENPKFQIPS